MADVSKLLAAADSARQAGNLAEAERLCREVVRLDPRQDVAWHFLGALALSTGRPQAAIESIRRAMEITGPRAASYNNLGLACQASGDVPAAIISFRQALALDPESAEAHNNLGTLYLRQLRLAEAAHHLQAALRLRPTLAAAASNLAKAQQAITSVDANARSPQPASDPAQAEAAFRLGNQHRGQGRLGHALDAMLRALAWQADHFQALVSAGQLLHQLGRPVEAARLLKRASEVNPGSASVLNDLGNVSQDLGTPKQSIEYYQRAIEADPGFVVAYHNLGAMLNDQGRLDEARQYLSRAQELRSDNNVLVTLATALPPVYSSREEMHSRRTSLERNVAQLIADRVAIDTMRVIVPNMFYAAYQGLNDRQLQCEMARVYQSPAQLVCPRRQRPAGSRMRVGFISKYFCDHTIGRMTLGLVTQLSRAKFHVTVIGPPAPRDPIAAAFQRCADQFVPLPITAGPMAVRPAIQDLGLDLLFFTDVGMDLLTYALSFSRMAPIQCVSWGHPVTTGSAAMDYFISSSLLEEPDAVDQYSEQLVRLPNISIYYDRPQLPEPHRDRESFGFAADGHLYGCPQTLFKFHPDFDAILGGILRADPQGELLLIEGKHPHWTNLLRERFTRSLGDVQERVHFLPPLSHDDFLSLTAAVDVLLDPIHFGGGNTSYEAFALGTPVVTLPSQLLRGRFTLGLYKQMGVLDCVVGTADDYVALAVRLGTDRNYRRAVSEKIRTASEVLFHNRQAVRDVEEFLESAIERGPIHDG